MSSPYRVEPDRELIKNVVAHGGEDLKKCFQCATCSVVCELSTGSKPFPRKEMIWAQWGLKDRLVADPNVWMCHQCNDCSTRCPRGARPGDVLAALRHQVVEHYSVPKCLGRCANQIKYLPLMILIPVVLLFLAIFLRDPIRSIGPLQGILTLLDHPGFYAELFPHWLLIGFFSSFLGLALLGAAAGLLRFWRAMKAADEASGSFAPKQGIVSSACSVLTSIFRHDKFSKCQAQNSRRWAHLGAFYGFIALFLVSVWAVIALYGINPFIEGHANDLAYPFKQWNPWKIFANLGAIALIVGCVIAIINRRGDQKESSASTSFDWLFVGLLLAVGVSGLLTEVLRLIAEPGTAGHALEAAAPRGGLAYTAYTVYFVHLVLVFGLLIYLPYSKFAHILYRTVALIYAEYSGRNTLEAEKA